MSSASWGNDLSIVTPADIKFLPGFYALFNSALMNGFGGGFKLLLPQTTQLSSVPGNPRIELLPYPAERFVPSIKPQSLLGLPAGNYLMLDADFIVERPCADLLRPIEVGLVVSTEQESKYDQHDVIVFQQARALGIATELPAYPYANGGFLGFQLPRDLPFLREYAELAQTHLSGYTKVGQHPWFKFLEQDVLNILVRKYRADGGQVFSVSARTIEIGPGDKAGRERPFPYTMQNGRTPPDRIKYFIHGASLRRPWLPGNALEDYGVKAAYRRLGGRLTAYERAWAYYACAKECPIPVAHWADRHGFTGYRHALWRAAYGLTN